MMNEKINVLYSNKLPQINSISSINVYVNDSISPSTEITSSMRKGALSPQPVRSPKMSMNKSRNFGFSKKTTKTLTSQNPMTTISMNTETNPFELRVSPKIKMAKQRIPFRYP
mmetsp:Transcript_27505/g.24384  ORF Transcript_27505/g.24384 Transcript_27505/m.24384 type:complete len:113 (+) Transcript_27505:165-503(+)